MKKKSVYEKLIKERQGSPSKYAALKRVQDKHPRIIAQNYITSQTIDKVMNSKKPSDHTYLVMNSIMCALNETESWPRAQKVTKNRA